MRITVWCPECYDMMRKENKAEFRDYGAIEVTFVCDKCGKRVKLKLNDVGIRIEGIEIVVENLKWQD